MHSCSAHRASPVYSSAAFPSSGVSPARRHRRARRGAGSERWPDFCPEAPELVEGLLPPHTGQVGEDHERLEAEFRLHLQQGVRACSGVPTIQDRPAIRSSSVNGGRLASAGCGG